MKILFIARKFPPSTGGMETFAYDLSQALAGKVDLRLVKWGGRGRLKAVLLALPYLKFKAIWVLLRGGVDVIHAQDGVLAPIGLLLAKVFRKPFTVVIHGLDITYRNPLFKMIVPAAVRRADAVFCISQAAAEECGKRGVARDKLHVIPLAVRDELYDPDKRDVLRDLLKAPAAAPLMLTVGRLVRRKGVAWFVDEVLPALVRQYPELIYAVVGEGPERENIEAAIKRRGLGSSVRLLGKVDDTTLAAAYNGADVFVMPNIDIPGDIEGFGLVLLEAALCARPIVAADLEGIKDAIIESKNGILVPAGDAAAFQAEVLEFLKDPAAARNFGERSRQFTLDNYRWDAIAERYIERYKRLIGR